MARIPRYLNDAQNQIANSVEYFTEEAAYAFTTVAGTALVPWPADLSMARSVIDLTRHVQLQAVTLSDIDRSSASQGSPYAYAMDGPNIHLYPTPDGAYSLELRYWQMPAPLVADTDVPSLPADWHKLLWIYAVAECYAGEDDPQTAQYWTSRFQQGLADFTANARFPNSDRSHQVKGMWDQGSLRQGWTLG